MGIPFYSNIDMNENEIENAKGGTNTSAGVSKIYLAQGTSGSSTFTIDDPELNVVDGTVIYAYTDRTNESLYGGFTLKINGELYYVYFKTNADTLEDNYLIARTVYQFILDKTNHKAFLVGGYICNIADMYRPGLVTLDQTLKSSWISAPATAAVYNAVNGLQTNINNLAAKQASSTELGLVKIGNGLSISTDGILSAAGGSSEITTILEADFATPKGLWEYDEGLYYVKCYYFNCYTSKANLTNNRVTMFTGPCWIVIDNASSMSYSKRVSVYAGDEVFYCAYNSLGGPSANQFDFKYTNYLSKDNTTAFTPTADYHPATKKYVDDNNTVTYKACSGQQIGISQSLNSTSTKADLTLLDCQYNSLNVQYTNNMMNYRFYIDVPEGALDQNYLYILSDIEFGEFADGTSYFIPAFVSVSNRAGGETNVNLSAQICRIDGCLAIRINTVNMTLKTDYRIEGTGMFLYRLK